MGREGPNANGIPGGPHRRASSVGSAETSWTSAATGAEKVRQMEFREGTVADEPEGIAWIR